MGQSGGVVKWEEKTIRRCVITDFIHGQSDQHLSFPLRLLLCGSVLSISAEEVADRCQPNFTQGKTDVLVREVQASNHNFFITSVTKSNVLLMSLMLRC